MSDSWSQHNSRVWGIDKPLLMRQGAERLSEGSGEMGCVPLGGQRTGGGEGAAGSGRRQVLAMEIAGLRDDWQ